MKRGARLLVIAAGVLMAACATIPAGPSVMVLPGNGKSFDQFQGDDTVCRQWADRQVGINGQQVAADSTESSAVIGTALGAAVGAAVGAAAGSPGIGAAAGAGAGLLGGTAVGASQAGASQYWVQRRYDNTYMQCMYARGNQIPVARGSQPYAAPPSSPPPAAKSPVTPPPPPAGTPPPPPPGPAR
jgi:hypothetical protein